MARRVKPDAAATMEDRKWLARLLVDEYAVDSLRSCSGLPPEKYEDTAHRCARLATLLREEARGR